MSKHESSCVKNAKSHDCNSDSKHGHKRKLVETGGHCYQSRARHAVHKPSVRSRGYDQYENDYECYDIKQECDPCQWSQPWCQPWPHGGQQPQHGFYPIKNIFFDSQSLCLSNYNMNGVDQMCLALWRILRKTFKPRWWSSGGLRKVLCSCNVTLRSSERCPVINLKWVPLLV